MLITVTIADIEMFDVQNVFSQTPIKEALSLLLIHYICCRVWILINDKVICECIGVFNKESKGTSLENLALNITDVHGDWPIIVMKPSLCTRT